MNVIKDLKMSLNPHIHKISNVKSGVSALKYNIDDAITARRSIGSRLNRTSQSLSEMEVRLRELQSFLHQSVDRYDRVENELTRIASSMRTVKSQTEIWARAQF